jgi:hypothetical protein
VRESVAGLASTRPYDLGRHTHSALMLASGMGLQRLARIQGHGIRVLDETYSEQLAEFEDRDEPIDPVREIERARTLVPTRQLGVRPGVDLDRGAGACSRVRGRGGPPQARSAQVKLPDVNLLLYAIDERSPKHERARPWLEEALSGTEARPRCITLRC